LLFHGLLVATAATATTDDMAVQDDGAWVKHSGGATSQRVPHHDEALEQEGQGSTGTEEAPPSSAAAGAAVERSAPTSVSAPATSAAAPAPTRDDGCPTLPTPPLPPVADHGMPLTLSDLFERDRDRIDRSAVTPANTPSQERAKPKVIQPPMQVLREIEAKLEADPSAAATGALAKLRQIQSKLSQTGPSDGGASDDAETGGEAGGNGSTDKNGALDPVSGEATIKADEGTTEITDDKGKEAKEDKEGEEGDKEDEDRSDVEATGVRKAGEGLAVGALRRDCAGDEEGDFNEARSMEHLDHKSTVVRKRERTDSDRASYAALDDAEARPRH